MKHRLMIRLCVLVLSCTALFRVSAGQATSSWPTPNEQYRQISQLMAQQNYEQAILGNKALIEQSPNYHHAYLGLVLAASEAGQLAPTRAWLESLLARTPPQPMAYVGLALISEVKRDYGGAVENYQKCLLELPDDTRVAEMLVNDYVNQDKGAEAEAYFKSLLAARSDSVAGHHGLGVLYALQQRRADALIEFDQTIALRPQEVAAYSNKALVLAKDGRHSLAIETLQICLRLLQANPDDVTERAVLNQLGDLYRRSGNYPEAAKNLDRVIVLARSSGDLRNEETALAQLASLHYRQNSYLKALEYWRQALEVSKVITSRKARLNTYPQRHIGGLGDVYDRLGDLAAAEHAYLEALTLSVEANDEANQSSVLKSLGDLYAKQGKVSQALAIEEQALALGEKRANLPNQLGALNSLSALYRQMGAARKAMEYVQRALNIVAGRSNPVWEGESLNNLGWLHLRFNELPQALAAFQKILAIDNGILAPQTIWQAHSGLAAAYAQLGQLERSREHYQQAIEVMENVRARLGGEEEKAGFFHDKIEVYKKQIGILLDPRLRDAKSHNAAEAFHYNERARARAFLDLLAEAKVDVEQNVTPDLAKQQRELKQRISQLTAALIKERSQETSKQDTAKIGNLEKGLGQADAELSDWLRELRRRNPRYAALKYPEPITLAETQRMLDGKTILLSYSLAEPGSVLFAVTRDDFQVRRLPSEATLGEGVQELLAAITDKNNPSPEKYRRLAARLSQQLLQPVDHMLAGKKALVIVADGALHRLPFEALLLPGAPAKGDLRRLPYLIRRFAISYAPSASVLAELQNQPGKTGPKGFIAFGDPVYEPLSEGATASTLRAASAGRLNFRRLSHSRDEVDGIAQLFANDDRELFLRETASEENVKAPERLSQYRMVHFSTHGYVNEARPRFSGLVLSLPPAESAIRNAQSEDGLLSAYEIFNLKLKADLVVLSACETGLGKEVKGEGLMSLTRAFIYAGTPSVVVSLWNVDDESAADLMIRFYRHLQTGRMSKAEALRQAQLETIGDNGFPFFWAPFVLVGQP